MKLMQACLRAGKTSESALMPVQACLSVRKVLENSFHYCSGLVGHVQSCLCVGRS